LDTDVGAYVDNSVMEAGNADSRVATADQSDRAADEGMLVDLGGFEAVDEGLSGEEVGSLSVQEEKLVFWRKCFHRLHNTPSLMPEQGDLNVETSWMEAVYQILALQQGVL